MGLRDAGDWKIHHVFFLYQGDVEYVCMLNDWIASSTKFALTITTLPSSG